MTSKFGATKDITAMWHPNFCLFYWLFYLDGLAFVLVFWRSLTWPLVERISGVERLLLVFSDPLYRNCWSTSQDIWQSMKVLRCVYHLNSLSTKQGSKGLTAGCCLLVGRIPRCQWLFQPYTFYYLLPQIIYLFLALIKLYYLLVSSLWCSTLVVIRRIHHVSSTLKVVLICMLVFPLHRELRRVQKICFQVFCSSSFWCISYSARLFCSEYSYGSLFLCHGFFFAAPLHVVDSGSKLPLALSAL